MFSMGLKAAVSSFVAALLAVGSHVLESSGKVRQVDSWVWWADSQLWGAGS